MLSSDGNIDTIVRLVEELRRYALLKGEYYRIDLTEKTVRVVSAVIMTIVISLLVCFVVGFLALTLAFALAPLTGKTAAFAIVAGVFLLLVLLCIVFRKKWIEAPLVRFFASILIK